MPHIKATAILKDAWRVTKEKITFLVGLTFVLFILEVVSSFILDGLEKSGQTFLFVILQVLVSIVSIIIGAGVMWISLKIVRGEAFQVSDIFTPTPLFFRYVGVNILYSLIVCAGILLLIVPGIIWAIKYSQVKYLILDRQIGILETFSESARMTDGSKMELFVLYLLFVLINVGGALLFGIGLLVTVPLTIIASALAYNLLLRSSPGLPQGGAVPVPPPPTPPTPAV